MSSVESCACLFFIFMFILYVCISGGLKGHVKVVCLSVCLTSFYCTGIILRYVIL
jgi:hypothetical protein